MLKRIFQRKQEPDWSKWRDCFVMTDDGKMVKAEIRYDYDNLTQQILHNGETWTATLEEQEAHVEAYRREKGL